MKKLIVLCMLIYTGAASCAQPSGKFTGSLLWKISGNGLEQPSYILGTHHLYPLSFFDEIAGARPALQSAEQVVGEMLMSDQGALATRLQLAAMMPDGESYEQMLSPTDYEALDSGLRDLTGVGLTEQFKVFKPGMISIMVGQIIFAQANPGFNPAEHVAIDVFVQNYAAEKGIPVTGLETIEDEIYAIFDAEPMKFQAEQLVCSIRNIEHGVKMLKKLGEYYAAGDIESMYADGLNNPDDPCPSSEASQNALLRERNEKWLKQLPAIMADKAGFIAVGAMHLAGEEGLLFQLDRMGYTVEPVK